MAYCGPLNMVVCCGREFKPELFEQEWKDT
jgi:hypothetical protein